MTDYIFTSLMVFVKVSVKLCGQYVYVCTFKTVFKQLSFQLGYTFSFSKWTSQMQADKGELGCRYSPGIHVYLRNKYFS